MGNQKGCHKNVMGLLGLGDQKIPSRIPDVQQKVTLAEPQVCLKCFGRVFRQTGRQFICVLCGEDVWLVIPN
mgnify:CR=1 FL=1